MNSEKSCGTTAQSEQGDQFIFILSSQETHIAPRYKVFQFENRSLQRDRRVMALPNPNKDFSQTF